MSYDLSAQDDVSSLHVLAYLFLRMNLWDKAERAYKAIIALSPEENMQPQLYMALAFIALEKNNAREALHYAHISLQSMDISSKTAVIYLLFAKALKMEGRDEESQNAIAQFSFHLNK